ncbi:MAG TPA: uroporphyrinogen decarboxylase family protein, partial [bacterium]|nr:uroporphyrinogen decarboxylase family protein [bacterium]
DHPPVYPEAVWSTTLARWRQEGLPENVSPQEYFGLEPLPLVYAGLNTGPFPPFEEKVLHQEGHQEVRIDHYGRTIRDYNDHTTMPEWLDFPVKSPDELKNLLAEKFHPDLLAERWPSDWLARVKKWQQDGPGRDYILFLDGGCYYGILRNLCGVETASYLFYDAADLVNELFERVNFFCLEGINRARQAGLNIDYLGFGEDIAFKTGPLVSPDIFQKFFFPRYRKVVATAVESGISLLVYDSDGCLLPLLDDLLKSGIDCFWPCEVAAGMDPLLLRKKLGCRLKMLGGIDKRALPGGKEAIKKEIDRKIPVVREGGYIPRIDHSVSSDISLENYTFYLNYLREILEK